MAESINVLDPPAAKLNSLYVVAIEYGGIVHGSKTLRYAVDGSGNAVALR